MLKTINLFTFLISCLCFLLTGCGGESSVANGNNTPQETATDPAKYADSILVEGKQNDDTIEYTSEKNEYALPEERKFDEFYNEVAIALNNGNASQINKFIHLNWGIYIVDRPGAIDKVDTAKNIEEFYKKIYAGNTRLKGMKCKLEHRPIPEITCDKAYTGCLAEATDNYKRISDLKTALKQYGFTDNYLPKDDKKLANFEKLIRRNIVNFDKGIGISFIYLDGKWFIGVIDMAKYSCSA